jgi:hypothetical protein
MKHVGIVRQIDQIYANVRTSEQVDYLNNIFAETFQLPIAWPPKLMSGGSYYGGGTFTGNTWLKFVTSNSKPTQETARYYYIIMEPTPLQTALIELEKRKIPYQTHPETNGSLWAVNIPLPSLAVPETSFSLCEYYPSAFKMTTTPNALNVEEHREVIHSELLKKKGGPLGIIGVEEIVLYSSDYLASKAKWQNLFDPIEAVEDGYWRVGSGPSLRLVESSIDVVYSVLFKVRSLEAAADYLNEHSLLSTYRDEVLSLDEKALMGLKVQLVK